ncbi:MAG: hypothetical protein WEC82_04595 [Xanthobacteraceae bacterium]
MLKHVVRPAVCAAAVFIAALLFAIPASWAQDNSIIGKWSLLWEGARDNYTGTLLVTKKTGDNLYYATVTLVKSDASVIKQEANITVTGKNIRIECFNPSVKNWNPDRFYVALSGKTMEGYSLDAAGQRGKKIVFKRQ